MGTGNGSTLIEGYFGKLIKSRGIDMLASRPDQNLKAIFSIAESVINRDERQ